ncbi:hypothetical protein Efla_003553 [Eimeria flavescens]
MLRPRMNSNGSSGSSHSGLDPSPMVDTSGVRDDSADASVPLDINESAGSDAVHLRGTPGGGLAEDVAGGRAAGLKRFFSNLLPEDVFLKAQEHRLPRVPRVAVQRGLQLLLLAVVLVHVAAFSEFLRKKWVKGRGELQPGAGLHALLGEGAGEEEAEEEEHLYPVEGLDVQLPVDDESMDRYEDQFNKASRELTRAWQEADRLTREVFARYYTPYPKDVENALQPFMHIAEVVASYKRPRLEEEDASGEQHEEGGAAEDTAGEQQKADAGAQRVESSTPKKKVSAVHERAEEALQDVSLPAVYPSPSEDKLDEQKRHSSGRDVEVGKVARLRAKFEVYIRLMAALRRVQDSRRQEGIEVKEAEPPEGEAAEQSHSDSSHVHTPGDDEATDSAEQTGIAATQTDAREEEVEEEEQASEGTSETDDHAAESEADVLFRNELGRIALGLMHDTESGSQADEEAAQAVDAEQIAAKEARRVRKAEKKAARLAMQARRRRSKEVREQRRLYAARQRVATALMVAARRRLTAIRSSLRFVEENRVSSPVYGVRGAPMPLLEKLKRKGRNPVGCSALYEQLKNRVFPAPESERPDVAKVPQELVDRLANAVKLSDMLIQQDLEVAAAFSKFLGGVHRSSLEEEDDLDDLQQLAAGSRLPIDPEGEMVFPVAFFRAVAGNLEALHQESFISDETIADWARKWSTENIWAQAYKLSYSERERTAAIQRIKAALRKEWSPSQDAGSRRDDVFLLALFLL